MALEINVQKREDLGGTSPTMTPADASGLKFKNPDDKTSIFIMNTNASPVTITVATARECEFGVHPDYSFIVPGNSLLETDGGFNPRRFTDAQGFLTFTFSSIGGISAAALRPTPILKNA